MDPIALSGQVAERYKRYLKTMFFFRDAVLRDSFEQALDSGHLSKGPYLEATPVFKKAAAPRALFSELLHSSIDAGFLSAVRGDRALYWHQEQAIRRVFEDHNAIVATGTGSGKTEAFLYPILLHLYREHAAGKLCPGVRALILYPMNALANDQRERLGEICGRLRDSNSSFRFTFGQYIGETPEDEKDSARHAHDHMAQRLPGELVLRTEIRDTPPHILLTNYSMLEYLLLRPADLFLFDNGQAQWWTFLVLDEAHQYSGSRGMEMGMLLRRLKQRLREGGRSKPFRCIATSATLAGGESEKGSVAKFASDLFGEQFREEDVILGQTEPIPNPGPITFSWEDYQVLQRALRERAVEPNGNVSQLAKDVGVTLSRTGPVTKVAGELLSRDHRAFKLRQLIKGNPLPVDKVAEIAFPDLPAENRPAALSLLIELLLQAEDPASHAPLMSARYHLFLRSLEGAFVQLFPEKKVLFDRNTASAGGMVFELALCRECGQHYIVAQKGFRSGKLTEPIRDPSQERFGVTFLRPVEGDEDSEEDDQNSRGASATTYELCIECGQMARTAPGCGHRNTIRVTLENSKDEDKADQIERCGVCGYTAAGRDPVKEVVYGADGPHAVIATTLYQNLERKKVLAFADGRQEAAFFAWYLDNSYHDLLSRNTILRVARSFANYPAEGISLGTIADRAFQRFSGAFKQREADDEPTIRRNIWRALFREFLTDEKRLSLEGVGLVRWSIFWPSWFKIPEVLLKEPWSFNEGEARDLIFLLLDTMRYDRAVELDSEEDVSLTWSHLELQGTQRSFRIGEPKGRTDIRAWDGRHGRRARFLSKLLQGKLAAPESVEEATRALRGIWVALQQSDEGAPTPRDRFLVSVSDARRLNPHWWRMHLVPEDGQLFRCDLCRQIQPVSIRSLCAKHHCSGRLMPIAARDCEASHYRLVYQEALPNTLVVEEHTAQLDHSKAREFQRDFREGKIHVLSCSTTFELGVDLGDLDTVFLRNVPPESFNYVQRVGRVGRRSGHPGFAVTYCRRNPHDLYHFSDPQPMLSGKIRPPALSMRNEKIILRHVAATALSTFFRAHPERFSTVAGLCGDLAKPTTSTDLRDLLHQRRVELEQSLRQIIPPDMLDAAGQKDGTWIDKIAGDQSRLAQVVDEVSSDHQKVLKLRVTAFEGGDDKTVKWAGDRAKTLEGEEVLSFLSRKVVIPKYGFPVDVVELDTQRTSKNQEAYEVSLQRDLTIAISEFAPTSELVANKKVWTSYGLKRVAEREWERWWYARCTTHARFERKPFQNDALAPHFDACCDRMTISMQYVEPRFGFITSRDRPKEPQARPSRVFTTRPYFAEFKDRGGVELNLGIVTLTKVAPGYMVVLCEGRRGEGFYICGHCGAGFRHRTGTSKGHNTPFGDRCTAPATSLSTVSLGHELVTDVLRLQFHPVLQSGTEPTWLALALGYALVEGAAETLFVPSTDLNATVSYGTTSPMPPIILYDNVPGGAGLVARLEERDVLRQCLEAARRRVYGNCGCGEDTSCYGCLRNYRNQFAHQHLQRGPVARYLDLLLTSWK